MAFFGLHRDEYRVFFDGGKWLKERFLNWSGVIIPWVEDDATAASFDGSTVSKETFENWPT